MKRIVRILPVESFLDTQPTEQVTALHAALQSTFGDVPDFSVERQDIHNWVIYANNCESLLTLKLLQVFSRGFLAGEEFGLNSVCPIDLEAYMDAMIENRSSPDYDD